MKENSDFSSYESVSCGRFADIEFRKVVDFFAKEMNMPKKDVRRIVYFSASCAYENRDFLKDT